MTAPPGDGSGWRRATLAMVVGAWVWHLWVGGQTGYGDAEAYYVAWSLSPELSYHDHPPLLAWALAGLRWLFGAGVLSVRVLPATVVSLVAWGVSGLCGWLRPGVEGGRAGFWAAAVLLATPVFGIGGVMATPDIPLVGLWVLALYGARWLLGRPSSLRWAACGALLGVAFLAKYTALALIPAVFVAASRRGVALRRRVGLWVGAGVALVVASPVLFWNASRGFPSLLYHGWSRHEGVPFHPKNAAALLGGQLGYLSPVIAGLLLWTYLRYRRRMVDGVATDAERQLGAFVAPVLIPLYVLCLFTSQAEPHWPAMGYLPLFAMAAVYLGEEAARRRRRWLGWSLGVALALQGAFFFHALSPFVVERLPASYEPRYDLVNELYGWERVIEAFDARLLPEERAEVRWAGAHYVMCGQITARVGLGRAACPSPKRDAFDDLLSPLVVGERVLFIQDNRYTSSPQDLMRCEERRDLGEVVIYRGARAVRWFQGTVCRYGGAIDAAAGQ